MTTPTQRIVAAAEALAAPLRFQDPDNLSVAERALLLAFDGLAAAPAAGGDGLTDAELAEIEIWFSRYQKSHDHPGAFSCCTAHGVADAVPRLVAALRAAYAERDQAQALAQTRLDIINAQRDPDLAANYAQVRKQRDDLRAAVARAEQATAEALRKRLADHYLADIVCDHDRAQDNPICACSRVHLGWHPSVGAAVAAWIDHALAADVPAAPEPSEPRIVCLCGSGRFSQAFREANARETLANKIVLSIGITKADLEPLDEDRRTQIEAELDELHKRKIDLADEVLILNVGGYVGSSTRSEIAYAAAHGKPIRWLEPMNIPAEVLSPAIGDKCDVPAAATEETP